MKLNYKAYNNASIVPVECGSEQGTAFFITHNMLLTARHILSDSEDNGDSVTIKIGDFIYPCSVDWEGNDENLIDLAILKCEGYVCPIPMKLLSLPPDRRDVDLSICGYPYENGGGRNLFEISVKPVANVVDREYDVITAPLNLLSFASYKGFSGSPVLNDAGSVVGIVTDQLNVVLGYKSLFSIVEILAERNLPFSTEWELEDGHPYGLGHANSLLYKQVGLAGDRFNGKAHVDNNKFMQKLERFTNKQYFMEIVSKLEELEKSYLQYARSFPDEKQILDWNKTPYSVGDYTRLSFFIQQAIKVIGKDPIQRNSKMAVNLLEALDKVDDYVNIYNEIDRKDYIIDGEAGTGKTHMMCWFSLHHRSPCYVYLIHGAQLVVSEDIEAQICHLCGFPDSTLSALDSKMETVEKYGVIILDAINECSSGSIWVKKLNVLRQTFSKYINLKLIITLRTGTLKNYFWERQESISGFENVQNAVNRYFDAFGVPKDFDWKKFKADFRNPLFLKLFCESFHYLNASWREDLKQIDVYFAYIHKCNEKISELIDEDIFRNILEKYMLKIASYSLYYKRCQDICREKARRIGDAICPGRLWSHCLLKMCLDENLLISMPDYKNFENEIVGFHFEKMGDFLRAYVLLNSKTDNERKVELLVDLQKGLSKNGEYEGKFRGLIGAFIALYDGDKRILDYYAFSNGELREYLVEALTYNTKYNNDIIVLLLQNVCPTLIQALLSKFNNYGKDEILTLHRTLLEMSMSNRDATWTESINEFCDMYGNNFSRWNYEIIDVNDVKRYLVLFSWLLSTSYPEARAYIIRKLYKILNYKPNACIFILKAMDGCNDPYVIEGVLCAVYGVVMKSRNSELVSNVANCVRKIFYKKNGDGPTDIVVRNWSLKIFERDSFLTPSSNHFRECTPPYKNSSPFEYLQCDLKALDNEDFFGMTNGSKFIYDSLYGFGDFSRYIIGTNSRSTSESFLYQDREEEVDLVDIQEMIAQRILEFGWNDTLGKYDNQRYSHRRYGNKKERIGKKYQWIAYYDILGRLSDNCQMKDSWTFGKPYKKIKSYPWYLSEISHFDPTLRETLESVGRLKYESPFKISEKNGHEWVQDNKMVPEIRFEFRDEENTEWIRLYGYESESIRQGEIDIEGFLYFNSHFVHANDFDKIIEWAKNKNFYGRWIREAPDMYQFLWNEYPWSDSYKSLFDKGEWDDYSLPVKTMVSCLVQMQENREGLKSEDYLSNAYLPCADMMSVLQLYTAERGIIRSSVNDDVVAASFHQLGLPMGGLAIKKKYLKEYLKKTGYYLFYFITGEKMEKNSTEILGNGLKELSSCWYFDEHEWHELQNIAVRTDRPQYEMQDKEDDYTWLEEFLKQNPHITIGGVHSKIDSNDDGSGS